MKFSTAYRRLLGEQFEMDVALAGVDDSGRILSRCKLLRRVSRAKSNSNMAVSRPGRLWSLEMVMIYSL